MSAGVTPDVWIPAEQSWFRAKLRTLGWVVLIICPLVSIPFFVWTKPWLLVFPALVLILALVEVPFQRLHVKHHAYCMREDEILVREGALSLTIRALPLGRVQHVDVVEGPIDARYGIAQVAVRSAAEDGGVTINGIPIDIANSLRDAILLSAESRRVEL
jgi:membrane protein YdbS with pleckstrin-like domain